MDNDVKRIKEIKTGIKILSKNKKKNTSSYSPVKHKIQTGGGN